MNTEITPQKVRVKDLDVESLESLLAGVLRNTEHRFSTPAEFLPRFLPEQYVEKQRETTIRTLTELRDWRRETGGGIRMKGVV